MRIAVVPFDEECARLLLAFPGVEVVACGDESPRARAAAERLGVVRVRGWDEVFALLPQAVVVAGEVPRRREVVERAAAVGAQVLCGHPLAARETDAEAMVAACEAAGVRLTVASPACSSPAFATVRRGIAEGGLGELMAVHGSANGPARSHEDGGALRANAPGVLDLVDAVLGGEQAAQVYAQVNSVVSGKPGTESAALLSVRYPSGVVAALDCSWGPPASRRAGGTPTVTFVGDQGSVEFTADPRLLGGFDTGSAGERWLSAADPRADALARFVASVAGGEAAGPDGAAAVRALRVVRAAYESARTGQPVDL